jgi:3-phenylpropionate/trans-cinnamate dioxygenase ferredoxin subunit
VRYVVAPVEEIPPGGRKIVTCGRREIGVFNVDGEFYALRNRCPHQGGPLCAGALWGSITASAPGEFRYDERHDVLTCPWHGWEFDVKTGQSWCDPAKLRTRSYPVAVAAGGEVESAAPVEPGKRVKGPYVAETVPVEVVDRFVVVEVRV